MPNIRCFWRYSSVENTVTDSTLQLLARVYSYSIAQAAKVLNDITGVPIEIDIEIEINQQHAKEPVPDSAIIQRSFKVPIRGQDGYRREH